MTDTHCHLASRQFDADGDAVIARAAEAGVSRLVAIGTDLEDGPGVLALAGRHAGVYAAVGIHPCDVMDLSGPDWIDRIRAMAGDPKVAAIGETGLDYFHAPPPEVSVDVYHERQKACFHAQLKLAADLGLNVVVHTRGGSLPDASAMVAEFDGRLRAVFHCWVDDWATARPLIERGHLISFTGISTYKNAPVVAQCVREALPGSFMFETDAPYLAPLPHRGRRCEPAMVRLTAENAARLRNVPVDELIAETELTAARFFHFSR